MLGNLAFLIFVIFSVIYFFIGVRVGIGNPLSLLSGIMSLFVAYLLIKLAMSKSSSGISINKNSLINTIKENRVAKVGMVTLLWILAIGNFTFANNWNGTAFSNGGEYIYAVILTIISFVILDKDIKRN